MIRNELVFKDDPRIASGELVGVTKGSIQTAESNEKRKLSQIGKPHPTMLKRCIICKKEAVGTNIHRWHNDKCKFKNFPNPEEAAKKWEKLPQYQKNKKAKKYQKTGILDL